QLVYSSSVRRFALRSPLHPGVAPWVAWVAVCGSLASGCIIELERRIACGDGYVDVEAGEACDPADPAKAYLNACAANGYSLGEAACDPQSCQIITNLAQCAVCGDGKAEQGEDCDRGVDPVQYCPDGSTKADCNDDTCLA